MFYRHFLSIYTYFITFIESLCPMDIEQKLSFHFDYYLFSLQCICSSLVASVVDAKNFNILVAKRYVVGLLLQVKIINTNLLISSVNQINSNCCNFHSVPKSYRIEELVPVYLVKLYLSRRDTSTTFSLYDDRSNSVNKIIAVDSPTAIFHLGATHTEKRKLLRRQPSIVLQIDWRRSRIAKLALYWSRDGENDDKSLYRY